jgi:hypothetical protein
MQARVAARFIEGHNFFAAAEEAVLSWSELAVGFLERGQDLAADTGTSCIFPGDNSARSSD